MTESLCLQLEEELLLQVSGEPPGDPARRRLLDAHLRQCAPCRAEKERLTRLFAAARCAAAPPELLPAQVDRLSAAVRRILEKKTSRGGWRPWLVGGFPRPLPALALALVLVVAAGGGLRYFLDRPEAPGAAERISEWSPRDIEVIRHLELLRDLETIEKIVHVVDLSDSPPGAPEGPEDEGPKDGDDLRTDKTA